MKLFIVEFSDNVSCLLPMSWIATLETQSSMVVQCVLG
jgi:hypothetical protein